MPPPPRRATPRLARCPWLPLLWIAALLLALIGLGNVPLRDWDEAIVARVSLEISRNPWPDTLLPTYLGRSYLNKPPGLHLGIAAAIDLWRRLGGSDPGALPPEWVVRLVPALGSSLVVPLLALVQARLRPGRPAAALATALIALTLLPLARHGRLAMLDGTQLTAMAVVWLGMLRAGPGRRRALAGGLVAGLGGSLLLLMKAPVAVPVLGGALLLRGLDRELDGRAWRWLLAGLLLGLVPGGAWHGWNLAARGPEALVMWGPQGIARLTQVVENNGGGPLVPVTQLLAGGWPWLPLLPAGLALAWRDRHHPAGRWTLGLALQAALMVFPLRTQLPWYSLLLWPPFALLCAPVVADLAGERAGRRIGRRLGLLWTGLGGLLLAGAALALAAPGRILPAEVGVLLLPAAGGLLVGGLRLATGVRPGVARGALLTVAGGWFLSLVILFAGPLWNWELGEQPPIRPALELAAQGKERATDAPLTLLGGDPESRRPSLLWYLDPASPPLGEGERDWPEGAFRLLARSDRQGWPEGRRCHLEEVGGDNWRRWHCGTASGGS